MKNFSKLQRAGVVLVGLAALITACTHQKVHFVGTHKVTVARHGYQKRIYSDVKAGVAMFEYEGVSTAGDKMKVSIAGDVVRVNGRDYGKLREGDSVLIGDDGVAVNSLDYGESEKYLRANAAPAPSGVN